MTPRLIVEVRWGRRAGTKAAIEAGNSLRVGRTERADLVLDHDGHLSGAHFELTWDGARAAVRDLGSLEGTKLGGQALSGEAEVPHGGWIEAGRTHFMVYVEGRTQAAEEELEGAARRRERRRKAAAAEALAELEALSRREPLYAVLDAARGERLLVLLREHVERHQSLYEGPEGEALEQVAPYLVGPMRADSGLLGRLVLEGWGRRWGIWCTSRERFAEVRRHWRRLLMVREEATGEPMYFRFYDPASMNPFWRAAQHAQRSVVSALHSALIVEQESLALLRLHVQDQNGHPSS